MASLYKKPVILKDPDTGKMVKTKSKKWWGRYKDALGREKRVPLATDKRASEAMLNELVKKVERERAGLKDPFEDRVLTNGRRKPRGEWPMPYRRPTSRLPSSVRPPMAAGFNTDRGFSRCAASALEGKTSPERAGRGKRMRWAAELQLPHSDVLPALIPPPRNVAR